MLNEHAIVNYSIKTNNQLNNIFDKGVTNKCKIIYNVSFST